MLGLARAPEVQLVLPVQLFWLPALQLLLFFRLSRFLRVELLPPILHGGHRAQQNTRQAARGRTPGAVCIV